MAFSDEQIEQLKAPLSSSVVKDRKQGGRDVSYVEGWHVIAEANRIFGFDKWTRETNLLQCISDLPREIGEAKVPGFGVTYVAKVKITVDGVVREGSGAGHGIDRDRGQAHESALKEAETDAMKRALMTFGNPFGLALYDKTRTNVVDEEEASRLRYVEQCKAKIAELGDDHKALLFWWNSEAEHKARRDFGLTKPELDLLKGMVTAKLPPRPDPISSGPQA